MEVLLKILIPILIQIESGGDDNALGDKTCTESYYSEELKDDICIAWEYKAVGCLQTHKVMVDDVNRIHRLRSDQSNLLKYADRKSRNISRYMCLAYLKHYGPRRISKDNTELENLVILGRMWNGGPQGYKKKATLPYARKITKLYNERAK